MKKLLASLLIACTSLATFSACSLDSVKEGFDKVKDKVESLFGKEEEETIDVAKAVDLVDSMYVDKIGKGRVDYEVSNSVMIGNTKYDVVWSVDVAESVVKLIRGEETTKVVVGKTLEADTDYKLTATVTAPNGETGSIYFNGTVAKMPSVFPELITEKPVEGKRYYLYAWHDGKKTDCYFNGNMDATYYFGSVSEHDDKECAEVYVEYVEGSETQFNIYFEKENIVTHEYEKQYLNIQEAWNNAKSYWTFNVGFATEPVTPFEYSEEYKTVVTVVPARSDDNYTNKEAAQDSTATVLFCVKNNYTTLDAFNAAKLETTEESVYVGGLAVMADATKVDDAVKVAFEKDVLSVENKYAGDATVELPVNGDRYADVVITWTDDSDNVAISEDGVMTITAPTEKTTFTLTANFKLNNAEDSKSFEITIAPALNLPEAGSTLTIEQAAAIGADMEQDTFTEGKYYVTGVIENIKNTTHGNMTIKDSDGNTLYVYGTWSADGNTRYDALETKPVVGDTVTVYGVIGNYNGAQMKNGWITAHTPTTTPPPVVDVNTSTIANIIAGADGTYQAEGTVVGIYARGFLLKDATGMILVYANKDCGVTIGQKLTVKGATGSYGGLKQFLADGLTYTGTETETVTQPTPVALDATGADAFLNSVSIQYVTVTGTVSVGSYCNLTIEGATIVGSIAYPNDAQKAILEPLNGKVITVTGYVIGVTGSSTKYLNMMMETAVEYVAPITDADRVATELAAITVDTATVTEAKEFTLSATPTTYDNVTISWTKNDVAISGDELTFTLTPGGVGSEETVTLVATVTCGEVTQTKEFTITVKGVDPQEFVNAEKDAFALTQTEVTTLAPLTLPTATNGGATIAWAVKDGDAVTEITLDTNPTEDSTVTLVATFTSGSATATKEFTVTKKALTVADSALLVDELYKLTANGSLKGGKYTLKGTVIAIDTTYSASYGNITVTMVIEGKEDKPVQCYRMVAGTITDISGVTVGDTLEVYGTLKKYNSTYELDTGCQLNAITKAESLSNYTTEEEILNAAFALEAGYSLDKVYSLTGVITSISGNNTVMTVGEKSITCYKLAGDGVSAIAVGDTITVSGILKNRYGTVQFTETCNLVSYELTTEHKVAAELNALEIPSVVTEETTLTLATAGATYAEVAISWTKDGADYTEGTLVLTPGTADVTITLIAMAKVDNVEVSTREFTIVVKASGSEPVVDARYPVANQTYYLTAVSSNTTYYASYDSTKKFFTSTTDKTAACTLKFEAVDGTADQFYIYCVEAAKYIARNSSKNQLTFVDKASAAVWTVDVENNQISTNYTGTNNAGQNFLTYNTTNPRFSAYVANTISNAPAAYPYSWFEAVGA